MDGDASSLAHTLTALLSCGCCSWPGRRRADYEAGPPSPTSALYEAPRPLTTPRAGARAGRRADDEEESEGGRPAAPARPPLPSTSGRRAGGPECAPLLAKQAPPPPPAPLPSLACTPPPPVPAPFHSSASPAKPGATDAPPPPPPTAAGGAPPPPPRPAPSGLSLAGLEEESDVCEVCLEPYTPDDPRVPLGGACGHGLHLGCTLAWLERGHDACPLCDGPIDGEAAALLDQ